MPKYLDREQLKPGDEVAIDSGYSYSSYTFAVVAKVGSGVITVNPKVAGLLSGDLRKFSVRSGYELGHGRKPSRYTPHLVLAEQARENMEAYKKQRTRESARKQFHSKLQSYTKCRIDNDLADKLQQLAAEAREFEAKYEGCW